MEILNKFALTVNSVSDLDQLLTACFDHIQQVIPIDSLSLILKQPDPIGHQRVFSIRGWSNPDNRNEPQHVRERLSRKGRSHNPLTPLGQARN